ncbi:MAG: hypothetical protein AAGJ83_08160, partial [Planctomycetota bacterium]
MLPDAVIARTQAWPTSAIGMVDGPIPPLMRMLLRSDSELADFFDKLEDRDLSALAANHELDASTLSKLALAIESLRNELTASGHHAITSRFQHSGIDTRRLSNAIESLPPQLLESMQQWQVIREAMQGPLETSGGIRAADSSQSPLNETTTQEGDDLLGNDRLVDDSRVDDLLVDDLLVERPFVRSGSDDLLADELSLQGEDRLTNEATEQDPLDVNPLDDADQPSVAEAFSKRWGPSRLTGWFRDDVRNAISYRANRHADPVLASLIESVSTLDPRDADR